MPPFKVFMLYLYFHCCCSVAKSCPTLYDPMSCSTTGFPVLHCLPEFAQTRIHWVSNANNHPSSVIPFSCPQSFPASGSFPASQLFASDSQSTGVSTSASVLTLNIQGWFPLGLAGLILLSKGLSRIFSSTTVQKHQFVSIQPSLGFPGILAVKESTYSAGDPGVGKIPWRRDRLPIPVFLGFPSGSDGKESACNAEDLRLILGLGRSPREGNAYPLQYSCLEDSMDREAWQATVYLVAKNWTWLSDFQFTLFTAFFMVQLLHPYMTTEKTTASTKCTFVGKVVSLLFNMLSRLAIAFLPRSKCLLI